MMNSMGYSAEKLLFIIRIIVRNTEHGSAESGDDTSYSDVSILILRINTNIKRLFYYLI